MEKFLVLKNHDSFNDENISIYLQNEDVKNTKGVFLEFPANFFEFSGTKNFSVVSNFPPIFLNFLLKLFCSFEFPRKVF